MKSPEIIFYTLDANLFEGEFWFFFSLFLLNITFLLATNAILMCNRVFYCKLYDVHRFFLFLSTVTHLFIRCALNLQSNSLEYSLQYHLLIHYYASTIFYSHTVAVVTCDNCPVECKQKRTKCIKVKKCNIFLFPLWSALDNRGDSESFHVRRN